MPKNFRLQPSSFHQSRKNYYNYQNDGHYPEPLDQNVPYHYAPQKNYLSRQEQYYNEGYNAGGIYNNYKNRRPRPYNISDRNGGKNNRTRWPSQARSNNKSRHNTELVQEKKKKPTQNAGDKLLAAETVTTNNSKKRVQASTIIKEKADPKKNSTPILDENIHKEITTESQPVEQNFQFIVEEKEVAFKTLKYELKLKKQREEDLNVTLTKKVDVNEDEMTINTGRLSQTTDREAWIQRTKQTRLYKICKEKVAQNVPCQEDLKTPDTSIVSSRWIERQYKEWNFRLVRFGNKFWDEICRADEDEGEN